MSPAEPGGPRPTFAAGLFAGARVLIAGGTSGIGASIAARFAHLGAEVVAAGLPGDAVAGPGVRTAPLDVRDPAAVIELVTARASLDVLVACAGVIRRDAEYDPAVFADVLDINLTGTMRMCVAAHPLLAASRGCIITTASMLSFVGGPRSPAYSASKAGIAALTRSLAVRWAPDGIRVNAIAPGWIRTALTAGLRDDPVADRRIVERTPMGRWGEPADIADVACFLASPGAGFMTGVTVPVDGGYLAA